MAEPETVSVRIGQAVCSHVVGIIDGSGELDLAADADSGPDLNLGREDDTRGNGNSRDEIEGDQMNGLVL